MHACLKSPSYVILLNLSVMFDRIYDLSEFLAMYIDCVTLNACLVISRDTKHALVLFFLDMLIIKID